MYSVEDIKKDTLMDNSAFEGRKTSKEGSAATVLKMNEEKSWRPKELQWRTVLTLVVAIFCICAVSVGGLFYIQKSNKMKLELELRTVVQKVKQLNDVLAKRDNDLKGNHGIGIKDDMNAGKVSEEIDTQEQIKRKTIMMPSKKILMHQSKPWLNVRLPRTIIPEEYDIELDIDMKNDTYKGDVKITVSITENTQSILVHMVNLDIETIDIRNTKNANQVAIRNKFYYQPNEFFVIQTDTILSKDDKYIIHISFTGKMGKELNGFYTSYDSYKKKVASTFFSPISARKAFPCLDEPAFKAQFTLTLKHSSQYKAQSNMKPVASCRKGNMLTTKFDKTLKMSTYLLCWVISEYNHIRSPIDNRISAWSNDVDDVRFALETSQQLLAFYEKYFNISYPLSKLDIVSIPSFGPGAMENWGIITFRAERILINQKTATQYLRQKSFNIIAHELVHQWFGNLVTMEFWNDAWLKEGFANNIGAIGGHNVDEHMGSKEQVLTGFMLPALEIDSYSTSHPISSNVKTPGDIRGVFDMITYNKGSCMVDLLHNYLGDDAFRKGLQSYLRTYAYKNANQDNLWEEMSKVSGKDVKVVMDTWTLQQGYPLISVRRMNKTHVEISQRKFSLDLPGKQPPTSPFGYVWKVPIIFKSPGTKATTTHLLEMKKEVVKVEEEFSVLNPDHSLFYRVQYDDSMMSAVTDILQNNPTLLTARDRAGLISDQFSFVTAKLKNIKDTLNLLSYLRHETDYYPWKVVLDQLSTIKFFISSDSTLTKFSSYISKLTFDIVHKVGWKNTTTANQGSLQELVLKHACQPLSNVYEEAKQYYINWVTTKKYASLRPSLHPIFKDCAISNGPNLFWDYAYLKYTNTNKRDDSLLWALTATSKKNKIKELLEQSLNNDVIDSQYTPYVVSNLAQRSYEARILCWQFIKENWHILIKRYATDVFMLSDMLSAVLDNLSTEELLKDVKLFFTTKYVGSGKNAVIQAIHKIGCNIEWKKNNFKDLTDWLNEQLL